MKNPVDGKYFAKLHNSEIFDFGPYDTREEAVTESQKELIATKSECKKFEVGVLSGYVPSIDWTVDNLQEQACDQGGVDMDYPDIPKDQESELDEYLTECLHKWLEEKGVKPPKFGLIRDVTEHSVYENK